MPAFAGMTNRYAGRVFFASSPRRKPGSSVFPHERMGKNFCVYILASGRNGTLYIGVTSDLVKRIWEHRGKVVDGFTKQYGVDKLVWYQQFTDAESAIKREKQMKEWKREWKVELIEKSNPYWRDLYDDLTQ